MKRSHTVLEEDLPVEIPLEPAEIGAGNANRSIVYSLSTDFNLVSFADEAEQILFDNVDLLIPVRYEETEPEPTQELAVSQTSHVLKKKKTTTILKTQKTNPVNKKLAEKPKGGLLYFLLSFLWTTFAPPLNALNYEYAAIATVVKVTPYIILKKFPSIEISLLKTKITTALNNCDTSICLARTIVAALQANVFGKGLVDNRFYSAFYPSHVLSLSITLRYIREGKMLSDTSTTTKEEMKEFQTNVYPSWEDWKNDKSGSLIKPDVININDHIDYFLAILLVVIDRIVSAIQSKAIRYDENVVTSDIIGNISSIYMSVGNVTSK